MKTSSKVHVAENGVPIRRGGPTEHGPALKWTSRFPPIAELGLVQLGSPCHDMSSRTPFKKKPQHLTRWAQCRA